MRKPLNSNPNPIYFMHLRYKEADGSISNFGGVTIAWREHENGEAWEVAYSRCNLVDNFCKRVGRAIAIGNLNFDRLHILKKVATTKPEVCKEVLAFVTHKLQDHWKAHHSESLH